jgi:LmbE family N-acetylglucosaminyl deacetylase
MPFLWSDNNWLKKSMTKFFMMASIRTFFFAVFILLVYTSQAQAPKSLSSSEIALGIQKLKVLGSVLYIAAHPDDENTRLLAYLSKEKMYRTGYLSITRGDGGQNLIGDEQGVELGLIRTQELLAARRLDGAEQFFTRAYDFGFSKSTEEAMMIWDKEKILSDVVWIIRNFKPDIIITRFPEDTRAGHGHHSASAVLAREAFVAAADPARFPEQFKFGVQPWQAKRIMWNTFNFGGANTTNESQFKVDVGGYLPLIGRSLGEIAADSRSQHKSQGFGVPSSRGSSFEYFVPLIGDAPVKDLLDGVNTSWEKIEGAGGINKRIQDIMQGYSYTNPSSSVVPLVKLYQDIATLKESTIRNQKLSELASLIEAASGLYLEASVTQPYAVQGDSIKVALQVNNRTGIQARLIKVGLDYADTLIEKELKANQNFLLNSSLYVPESKMISQPYWLNEEMKKGSFEVTDQKLIGMPENKPSFEARFIVEIEGVPVTYRKPIQYKHTDPVKGEHFDPVYVVPPVSVNTSPAVILFKKGDQATKNFQLTTTAYSNISRSDARFVYRFGKTSESISDTSFKLSKGLSKTYSLPVSAKSMNGLEKDKLMASVEYRNEKLNQANYLALAQINYDHIPALRYFYPDGLTILNIDLKTAGKKIGYIKGAGDKVPEALEEMGYQVTYLGENDMKLAVLQQYDAIITGIRAYNIYDWLNAQYEVLMSYVSQGGNLVVQYNTNSFIGPVKARMGPVNFNISRNRVTDENSAVQFLEPSDPLLNWPNKISQADFQGWIQERGVYFAEIPGQGVKAILGMRDAGETEDQKGSLIVSQLGKGRFIYTGLVFFRQLPAGVPGAYRLFANLISNPNATINGSAK